MIKYNVISEKGFENNELIAQDVYKTVAIGIARKTAIDRPTDRIYVEWFRKEDGQKGFLNPNGDHAIKGIAW